MKEDLRTIGVFDDAISELLRDKADLDEVLLLGRARAIFAGAVGDVCGYCGGCGVIVAHSLIVDQSETLQCRCARKAA